jgi:hypothetical protein
MGYTLGDAARATGLNKSTILRAIRSGKVSGTKDVHGQWCIEACELHRTVCRVQVSDCTGYFWG